VPEAYVHRIGRTARAGATGVALSLVADDERNLLRDIQKLTRQTVMAQDRRGDKALGAQAAVERKLEPEEPHVRRGPSSQGGGSGKQQHRRRRSGGGSGYGGPPRNANGGGGGGGQGKRREGWRPSA
jgi:ATP-dependent RNA helicase RhlE